MKRISACAAALALTSTFAHASPMTWELLNSDMIVVGTFDLDLDTATTSNAQISGDIGFYTIPSSFTFLNSSGTVDGYPVNNYFKFFSTEAGQSYLTEFGPGEYNLITLNDSAIDIGTLGVLVADGTLYDAYIHEIYNFDEVTVTCSWYEEIYDEEGNWIGDGPCAWYDTYADFNVESGYSYDGFYLRSQTASVDVPIAPTAWLLLMGLAGLGIGGRQAIRSEP